MRLLVLSLAVISLLISCADQPNLEGLWYVDAQNDRDGNPEEYSRDGVYLSFNKDSVLIMRDPLRGKNETNTYVWELSDSIALLGNTSYSFQYNIDSLVLVSQDDYKTQLVLKKINENRRTDTIVQEFFQGRFRIGSSDRHTIRKLDFLTDSIVQHESGIFCSGYPFTKWSLFELDGFTFLEVNGLMPLFIVESYSHQRVTMYNPNYEIDTYFLEKIDEPIKEKKLVGEWVEKDNIRSNEQGDYEVDNDQRYRLSVGEDSLLLLPHGTKKRWVLGVDEHHIYFLNSWFDPEWELFEYSDSELKIGIYDTITYNIDTIYFKKK